MRAGAWSPQAWLAAAGMVDMAPSMTNLAADLADETAVLRELVANLDQAGWQRPTPAPGWSITDQISHLAYFDDAAVQAATTPDVFAATLRVALESGDFSADQVAERYRSTSPAELLSWFDTSRRQLIEVYTGLDPSRRVPWFGPPMSAASSLTARIMETWAHGQDVADALGVVRSPSQRLRHVAHIGARAIPFSFAARGLDLPADPVRVELTAPDGATWTWGPADAANRVTGPALDFCLLVTQRRNSADLAVTTVGPVATEWLPIAQAFAGPPGPGREPGQFSA